MANEDKKDFNAMLMDSKDMPKVQIITDEKSIEKYGGDGTVYTVEGNSGDACKQRQYAVGSSNIYGYGIPAY